MREREGEGGSEREREREGGSERERETERESEREKNSFYCLSKVLIFSGYRGFPLPSLIIRRICKENIRLQRISRKFDIVLSNKKD